MICSIIVSYLNGSVKIANISFEELGVLFISGILKNPDTYTYFCNIHGNYISIEDITKVIEHSIEMKEAYLKLAMLEYGDLHPN